MKYVSVEEGRAMPGLRLVLTAGVPGPWGEAAKAVFRHKRLRFTAVLQESGGENPALREWTGHANAPTAVYGNQRPCGDAFEILLLAERLAPEPRMIPQELAERVTMFGLLREIAGREGLGWHRRSMMLAPLMRLPEPPEMIRRIAARYDYSEQAGRNAPREIARIVDFLGATLEAQSRRGSRWFVGDTPGAVDLYWAIFSMMLAPLPLERCPVPAFMHNSWSASDPLVDAAVKPILLEHREAVFAELIPLPLDFAVDPQVGL